MIYQRLAALFGRYCNVHLAARGQPLPLVGETGETLGHVDRIAMAGGRFIIEGWADCDRLVLSQSGQSTDFTPTLPRQDVALAYPALGLKNPGFAANLPRDVGRVTLSLVRGTQSLVYDLPMPSAQAIRHAKLALIPHFLRDLMVALPAILHWFATKDPADRARLKRCLRLTEPQPTRTMQPLLFLADSLSSMPAAQQISEMARLRPAALSHRAITIILPIYNAFDLLPEVLDRVLQHTDLPWRLILIDDASSDPAVRPYLRNWVAGQKFRYPDRITLIEHAINLGFIRSVNAGLNLAIGYGDHVVLLNSDAFLPKAWATRLLRPFLAHDRVATVTPMSNEAEIFTAPVICNAAALKPGDGDAIDALAATFHPDAALADAPTGVGFCMAMSIDYLRKIPQLDPAFGRGYGEEVDWCQKARALGGRHLGTANLFVEHRGGTSFGTAEKQQLVAQNNAIISRRYPAYDAEVQHFIANDPLATSRLALAIGWAAAGASGPIPIFLAHNLGGGAEDYLAQRIAQAMPAPALVLRVGTHLQWQLELHSHLGVTLGGTDDFALIQRLLDPIERLTIIYSCGVGDRDPIALPEKLLALKRGPQDQIDVLIHDYLPISPSYTLLDAQGRYLGPPTRSCQDPAHCAHGPRGLGHSLADWQSAWGKLIAAAREITVFSQSSAKIIAAIYPDAQRKLNLVPHQSLIDLPRTRRKQPSYPRVIGILGNIGHHKGAAVLQCLSNRLESSGQARLVVLGKLDPMYPLAATAHIHGGYHRSDIPALIAKYRITDWLIPSIWPETFSYTTHEAIATGLPVWAFDLGAQGDAVRNQKMGGVLPIPDGTPDIDQLLAIVLRPQIESTAA